MLVISVVAVFMFVTHDKLYTSAAECSKLTKAETYLDTALDLIEKSRENLPEIESNCNCSPKPMDCSEVLSCGHNVSGIYKVWPRNRILQGSIDVYCDMTTEGGGWTVILKRADYKRPNDFFYKNWHKYKTGFGDFRKDFWLGNDNIFVLTNQDRYFLLISVTDYSNFTRHAFYDQFWIDNEERHYKLHVYDYSGDAGDEFEIHNQQYFSTYDRNNGNVTKHCGSYVKSGWWYSKCLSANLNGLYGLKKNYSPNEEYEATEEFAWGSKPLISAEMKIRPADFRMHSLDMQVDIA